MSIDAIDAAFMGRCGLASGPAAGPLTGGPLGSTSGHRDPVERPASIEAGPPTAGGPVALAARAEPPPGLAEPVYSLAEPLPGLAEPPVPAPQMLVPEPPRQTVAAGTVLDRLLVVAWPQWNRLAETVEGARARGRRVIAVAGGERSEGRSTLVAGLARVLRARGREVVETGPDGLGAAREPSHDKRIVIVDAGIWFPPGPIRRQRLTVASLGCEAAILVRRACRPAAPTREAVLESLGIEVLGEVVSFATPTEIEPTS